MGVPLRLGKRSGLHVASWVFAAAAVTALAGGETMAAALPAAASAAVVVHCHARDKGLLPDARCTPGVTYAKVTQGNIGRTICKSGWTSTVRPPESYTENLKREQIIEYGYRDKRLHDYEEDHLIPLELGGSPRSVKNLWPEFDGGHIPNPKDKVENALKDAVCDGTVSLRAAQRAIASDWLTAEKKLGL
jgi:hypothetical protein